MAIENLLIAQQRDTLKYACIRSGTYRPQFQWFKISDYVYLQCEAPTTLAIRAKKTILRVKAILFSGVLLEGKYGQECRDNT